MSDIIVLLICAIIIGLAIRYIIKSKKQGVQCIGCPHAKTCGSKQCNCSKE